jgi:hypothetical protein
MTGILQPVATFDEADCKPGQGSRRMHETMMFQSFDRAPDPAGHIFAYCAAQFLGGLFYG